MTFWIQVKTDGKTNNALNTWVQMYSLLNYQNNLSPYYNQLLFHFYIFICSEAKLKVEFYAVVYFSLSHNQTTQA